MINISSPISFKSVVMTARRKAGAPEEKIVIPEGKDITISQNDGRYTIYEPFGDRFHGFVTPKSYAELKIDSMDYGNTVDIVEVENMNIDKIIDGGHLYAYRDSSITIGEISGNGTVDVGGAYTNTEIPDNTQATVTTMNNGNLHTKNCTKATVTDVEGKDSYISTTHTSKVNVTNLNSCEVHAFDKSNLNITNAGKDTDITMTESTKATITNISGKLNLYATPEVIIDIAKEGTIIDSTPIYSKDPHFKEIYEKRYVPFDRENGILEIKHDNRTEDQKEAGLRPNR